MIKTRFPNVKLISNDQNLGFPKGNNIGVAEAKGWCVYETFPGSNGFFL